MSEFDHKLEKRFYLNNKPQLLGYRKMKQTPLNKPSLLVVNAAGIPVGGKMKN